MLKVLVVMKLNLHFEQPTRNDGAGKFVLLLNFTTDPDATKQLIF